jgi:hypothetical protein
MGVIAGEVAAVGATDAAPTADADVDPPPESLHATDRTDTRASEMSLRMGRPPLETGL